MADISSLNVANGQNNRLPTDRTVDEPLVRVSVPTAETMRAAGQAFATILRSQDVVLLSGPLGAGKTTFAQGIGKGLKMDRPVVSPTFTIARELDGTFSNGSPAHLVHVDAYRIGGVMRAPGDDARDALLDQLESLGLDEELDDPSEGTVILMEWGEHMAGILSDERCEVRVLRAEGMQAKKTQESDSTVLTADGPRTLLITGRGKKWADRLPALAQALNKAGLKASLTSAAPRKSGQKVEGKGSVA